ncbi:unnamed protein product, partial [Mesorhabditis spiculigera]
MTPDELEFHEYFIEPCLPQVKNSLRPASQCARNFTANQPVYSRLLAQEVDPYAKSRLIHQLYQIEDDPEYAAQLADLLYGHSGDWQPSTRVSGAPRTGDLRKARPAPWALQELLRVAGPRRDKFGGNDAGPPNPRKFPGCVAENGGVLDESPGAAHAWAMEKLKEPPPSCRALPTVNVVL